VNVATLRRPIAVVLFVLILAAGVALFFSACVREEEKEPSAAPDFSVTTLDGREITLSKMKGKAVLIDFWATWCKPCREAIPHLVDLYKTDKEKGFEVIGLSMDTGDPEVVRRFVESMDIPYPVAIATEELSRKYRVSQLPTTFLIDKEGKIRQKTVGFNPTLARQITTQAAELIAEKPQK
jgi:cytochrome c biogenesis protein CcmG/thiol:disulfide interchange protein DsbE